LFHRYKVYHQIAYISSTFYARLAENDVPLSDIQHQVGHTTVEMTLKYLRQRQEENERKRVLNNAFRQQKRNDEAEVTKK
jgi:integrase